MEKQEIIEKLGKILSHSCILIKRGYTFQDGDKLLVVKKTASSNKYDIMINLSNISGTDPIIVNDSSSFDKEDAVGYVVAEKIINNIFK